MFHVPGRGLAALMQIFAARALLVVVVVVVV